MSEAEAAMTGNMIMKWELRAFGSALFTWEVFDASISIATSYIGDALGGLMQAAIDLRRGSSATFTHLLGEPGGYRAFFSVAADGEVFVQIVRFGDLQSEDARWKDGELVWSGRVATDELIASVGQMGERVLHESGLEGYQKAWGRPFPIAELTALRELL